MTPLQTALAAYDNNDPREDDERMVLAAARSLAEGKTIWWCEVHLAAAAWVTTECNVATQSPTLITDCRMVEKILADPPDKEP